MRVIRLDANDSARQDLPDPDERASMHPRTVDGREFWALPVTRDAEFQVSRLEWFEIVSDE